MKDLTILSIILLFTSCNCCNPVITDWYYVSYSYKGNSWRFTFNKNGTFSYLARGTIEFSQSNGTYEVENDTLVLNSQISNFTTMYRFERFREKKFLIEENTLIDLETGYVYINYRDQKEYCIDIPDREALRKKDLHQKD